MLYKKISYIKVIKGEWFQNLPFWIRNGLKLTRKKNICRSLSSILLCIVGELAGGGSVAVAVGVTDM